MVSTINKQENEENLLNNHVVVITLVELNSDMVKPSTISIVIGTMAFLNLNFNKRHKTPNPIIAINVFIFYLT
jgi:hypothetical protein